MKTRGLILEFNEDGVPNTKKVDPDEFEKKKIRKTYGTKITEALLKSFQQIKSDLADSSDRFKMDAEDDEKYVKRISDKICNMCYDEYGGNQRVLKRKIFEICSNIKRESNEELREKILLRRMSIKDLVTADTLELAPEDVREKRKKEIEHHYIRNVILKPNPNESQNDELEKPGERLVPVSKKSEAPTREAETINTLMEFFSSNNAANTSNNAVEGFKIGGINKRKVINEPDEPAVDRGRTREVRETPIKLNNPPRSEEYHFEAVNLRIIKRVQELPALFTKPFLDPLNTATKRIQMLMYRSSILNKKVKTV